jgi:PiT family inorganic phosphate transporter
MEFFGITIGFVFIILVIVIVTALVFEYVNGFQDCANAIATIVATKVLTPKQAVIFAAVLNFFGALSGTAVAKTIGSGIVNAWDVTLMVVFCGLLAAIIWCLITWWFGLPVSCSHSLIGGLVGAVIAKVGMSGVQLAALKQKVIVPMFASPVVGFIGAFLLMVFLMWLIYFFFRTKSRLINRWFRKLQLFSAGLMAFAHGSNDAQKVMGIIMLALFTAGYAAKNNEGTLDVYLPVIFICALTMGMGTMVGGWKIVKTLGHKVIKLKPIHGFAAETTAALVILSASKMGMPLSTTHVISTSIMGVGASLNPKAVNLSIVKNIVIAWILTMPMCIIIAMACFWVINSIVTFFK